MFFLFVSLIAVFVSSLVYCFHFVLSCVIGSLIAMLIILLIVKTNWIFNLF
jgi:hypothetical protein